ncbi:MAG TPA: hypothetical protein VHZ24_15000 [Pirellulales bacterium]|jgi:hypothetical protein|nr:hypothetical protein [Pirellulales bacterium]
MSASRAAVVFVALATVVGGIWSVVGNAPRARSHEGPDDATARSADSKVLLFLEVAKKDTEQRPWKGNISASPGRVVSVEIDRAAQNSTVKGNDFDVRAKRRQGANKAAKKQNKKNEGKLALDSARLKVVLDCPPTAKIDVDTGHGEFSFVLADVAPGSTKMFLNGEASIERAELALPLTGMDTEDDFPVIAKAPDGTVWMAYVEYQPGPPLVQERLEAGNFGPLEVKGNGDHIHLVRRERDGWSKPVDVTAEKLDIWRPTIAVDGRGVVVLVWSQKVDGDWNLFTRRYDPSKQGEAGWSPIRQLTQNPGSDFQAVATTDSKGKVWIAWQSWRDDNYEIVLSAVQDDGDLAQPFIVSTSKGNDWTPAIAADGSGGVYVAWDTYDKGNYDVLLYSTAKPGAVQTVADSPRFEARAALTCDGDGRVWVAYEQGDEQWGKDYSNTSEYAKIGFEKNAGYALYINRTLRVKCLIDGSWKEPSADLEAAFAKNMPRGRSVPRLVTDSKGGLWLSARHALNPGGNGEAWQSYVLRYDGRAWSTPMKLASSSNLMDNRPAFVEISDGLLTVYSGDDRTKTQDRGQDDLYAAVLPIKGQATTPELRDAQPPELENLAVVHPNEKDDVARMRGYRVTVGGQQLQLFRGEFHRHTEFSAHRDGDGLLEDSLRYAHDAVDHDWMGNGDHDNGLGHEYMWWLIQKTFDIHTHAPHFLGAMTYERSVQFPNGHRNVIMPRRGIRPLPRGDVKSGDEQTGTPDTKMLYAYLKNFGGMCASHTSGTNMGTDWRDNDPDVEPVVEIYQGHRHNYEHFGAPRSATEATQIGGYQPSGFVWNALERGYRLGFQSSSDHISTHISYAVVVAPELSRQAIIDAFKKRHCYAATENIVLVVRSGEHLMGDQFSTKERPTLTIEAEGTGPIAKLHIVRDNKYVYNVEPNERQVRRTWTDTDAVPGKKSYYYVRIEQADGDLAWASPMWITYQP